MTFKLNLGSRELKSVAAMGGLALLGGVLYQLSIVYVKQASDQGDLMYETSVLHTDSELFALFIQIEESEHYAPRSYEAAVYSADKLMYIWKGMKSGSVEITKADVAEAVSRFKTVDRKLSNIYRKAYKKDAVSKAAQLERLAARVYPRMQEFYADIQRHYSFQLH